MNLTSHVNAKHIKLNPMLFFMIFLLFSLNKHFESKFHKRKYLDRTENRPTNGLQAREKLTILEQEDKYRNNDICGP